MSTNKTQNYHLHAWEAGDDFLRTEFNENFAASDAARKAIAGTVSAEQTAREKAVSAEAKSRDAAVKAEAAARSAAVADLDGRKVEIVVGMYQGDGASSRVISLGFTPKAVLVINREGRTSADYDCFGGLALPGHPVNFSGSYAVEIVEGGFKVVHASQGSRVINTNSSSYTYHYLAVK